MSVALYHNPGCSKSRAALALIEARGIRPRVIEYQKTPPTVAELEALLARLRMKPRELLRKQEPVHAQLGLGDPKLTDRALIEAMVANPILIERPIAVNGKKVALGRPPEAVLEILPAA